MVSYGAAQCLIFDPARVLPVAVPTAQLDYPDSSGRYGTTEEHRLGATWTAPAPVRPVGSAGPPLPGRVVSALDAGAIRRIGRDHPNPAHTEYLATGAEAGFPDYSATEPIDAPDVPNMPSADGDYAADVQLWFEKMLESGWIIEVTEEMRAGRKLRIIPIGTVFKSAGPPEVRRIIFNLSHKYRGGPSVNDGVPRDARTLTFSTPADIGRDILRFGPAAVMSSEDVTDCFYQFGTRPEVWSHTCFRHRGVTYALLVQSMGAAGASRIAEAVTSFTSAAAQRACDALRPGLTAHHHYADDLLQIAATKDVSDVTVEPFREANTGIGLPLKTKKRKRALSVIDHLGLRWDIPNLALGLPADKVARYSAGVRALLTRGSATRVELEQVAGRLGYAAITRPWGRVYLQHLFTATARMPAGGRWRLSRNVIRALRRWLRFLEEDDRSIPIRLVPGTGDERVRRSCTAYAVIDATNKMPAGGGLYACLDMAHPDRMIYSSFGWNTRLRRTLLPDYSAGESSGTIEARAMVVAVALWVQTRPPPGARFCIISDNMANRWNAAKGRSTTPAINVILETAFELLYEARCFFEVAHNGRNQAAGKLADALSRGALDECAARHPTWTRVVPPTRVRKPMDVIPFAP